MSWIECCEKNWPTEAEHGEVFFSYVRVCVYGPKKNLLLKNVYTLGGMSSLYVGNMIYLDKKKNKP